MTTYVYLSKSEVEHIKNMAAQYNYTVTERQTDGQTSIYKLDFTMQETNHPSKYVSIQDVKNIAQRHGSHWFDADTMRFFNSRVSQDATIDGEFIYFVSSERYRSEPRLYSVRQLNIFTGIIETIGEFQQYRTSAQAKKVIKSLLRF